MNISLVSCLFFPPLDIYLWLPHADSMWWYMGGLGKGNGMAFYDSMNYHVKIKPLYPIYSINCIGYNPGTPPMYAGVSLIAKWFVTLAELQLMHPFLSSLFPRFILHRSLENGSRTNTTKFACLLTSASFTFTLPVSIMVLPEHLCLQLIPAR